MKKGKKLTVRYLATTLIVAVLLGDTTTVMAATRTISEYSDNINNEEMEEILEQIMVENEGILSAEEVKYIEGVLLKLRTVSALDNEIHINFQNIIKLLKEKEETDANEAIEAETQEQTETPENEVNQEEEALKELIAKGPGYFNIVEKEQANEEENQEQITGIKTIDTTTVQLATSSNVDTRQVNSDVAIDEEEQEQEEILEVPTVLDKYIGINEYLLAQIGECEAGGSTINEIMYTQKTALNRVEKRGMSLEAVVSERGQYPQTWRKIKRGIVPGPKALEGAHRLLCGETLYYYDAYGNLQVFDDDIIYQSGRLVKGTNLVFRSKLHVFSK